jgi:hypothetical protein
MRPISLSRRLINLFAARQEPQYRRRAWLWNDNRWRWIRVNHDTGAKVAFWTLHSRELQLTTIVAVLASAGTIVVQLAAVHGVNVAFVEIRRRSND